MAGRVNVTVRIQDQFFVVQSFLDKKMDRVFSQWGMMLAKDAKDSLPRGRTVTETVPVSAFSFEVRQVKQRLHSSPGEPPHYFAEGPRSLRNIQSSYSPRQKRLVVGPTKFGYVWSSNNVPETLEYGGVARWQRPVRVNGKRVVLWKTAHIAPRPFMRPAMNRQLPALRRMLKG